MYIVLHFQFTFFRIQDAWSDERTNVNLNIWDILSNLRTTFPQTHIKFGQKCTLRFFNSMQWVMPEQPALRIPAWENLLDLVVIELQRLHLCPARSHWVWVSGLRLTFYLISVHKYQADFTEICVCSHYFLGWWRTDTQANTGRSVQLLRSHLVKAEVHLC